MHQSQLRRLASVEDFRRAARRRLPRIFADYVEGGASGEVTLAANTADFERIGFRPRVLRDVATRDLSTDFLGGHHALPLMLGPVGSLGLFRAGAETAAFRAAAAAGVPACLSSFAVTRPETLAPVLGEASAFQLYVLKDRGRTEAILDRIAASGFGSLFVTVDTAVSGIRERDIRNGLRQLSRPDLRMLADFASHPFWLADMARVHPAGMALAEGWPEAGRSYLAQSGFLAGQIDPALDWAALSWLRDRWKGRLVVKGIQTPEDALECAGRGVDGIVVSNHGGRQLDDVPSTIRALGPVVDAVGDQLEVLVDGGIRSGLDVVKALALGARACLIGRAWAWAVAGGGQAGVEHVLRTIRGEMEVAMSLTGAPTIDDLGPEVLLSAP